MISTSWIGQRCYNGVRLLDTPSSRNVQRLDLGAWPMIEMMHRYGIRVDVPYMTDLDSKLARREAEIREEIRLFTEDVWVPLKGSAAFNPGSADQVARLLFDQLGLKPVGEKTRKLKSGRYTTEDEILSAMVKQHPVVQSVLDFREVDKLRSTYTGPIPLLVGEDGRLRTIFKATRTATGRLASGDRNLGYPNMQNIPMRGEWGPLIRNAFIAKFGNVLVSGDLSQIEMRMAAHLSGDAAMCAIFHQRLDIHNRTACSLFKLAIERINYLAARAEAKELAEEEAKEWKYFRQYQRAPAKNLGFGVLYGLTAEGLQKQILAEGGPLFTTEQCQEYIDGWFAAYPGIKEWMELQYFRAQQFGMVWDFFGRTRPIPEAKSVLQDKVNEGMREAGNMPIQAGAQGIIKLVMAEMMPIIRYFQSFPGVVCWPLLQIHDEIITECSRDIAQDYADILRSVMQHAVTLLVPVDSSADVAERWGELK